MRYSSSDPRLSFYFDPQSDLLLLSEYVGNRQAMWSKLEAHYGGAQVSCIKRGLVLSDNFVPTFKQVFEGLGPLQLIHRRVRLPWGVFPLPPAERSRLDQEHLAATREFESRGEHEFHFAKEGWNIDYVDKGWIVYRCGNYCGSNAITERIAYPRS